MLMPIPVKNCENVIGTTVDKTQDDAAIDNAMAGNIKGNIIPISFTFFSSTSFRDDTIFLIEYDIPTNIAEIIIEVNKLAGDIG